MVTVAAVALGSSTYAWFVASNTVTAKGMKVQAMAESGLVISHDSKAWGSVATTDKQEKNLSPVSTKDLKDWYHATALNSDNYTAGTGISRDKVTKEVFNGSDFEADNIYVFRDEFKIRSTASGDNQSKGLYVQNIDVTVNGTDATQTMSNALRVGVAYGNTYKIFAPVSVGEGPTTTYGVYDETGTQIADDFTVTTAYNKTASNLIGADTAISSDANSAVTVYIYVWFEGEDSSLYSDNFNAEDLNISVDFSSIPATA